MRPTVTARNGIDVDVEIMQGTIAPPLLTHPPAGATFFTAGTSALHQYGLTPEAGRLDSAVSPGVTVVEITQTDTEAGFVYQGHYTGVAHEYVGYDPDEPQDFVPPRWNVLDERGRVLAEGVLQYDPDTLIATIPPTIGDGPRWTVNTVFATLLIPQP